VGWEDGEGVQDFEEVPKNLPEARLSDVYDGEVVLLAPSPADEGSRGWLFAR